MKFTGTLSQGFVLSKPIKQENYKPQVLDELEKHGKLIITRKRDGWKLFAATGKDGRVRLYTDGMNEVDERLDHIAAEVRSLKLPPCSLLVGEVLFDREDDDELGGVQSVMGASTEKALAFQKANGLLRYMLFGVLYLDGEQLTLPFREILTLIDRLLAGKKAKYVFKVPVLEFSLTKIVVGHGSTERTAGIPLAAAQKTVLAKNWEGLVLYDADFVPEIRLDGKDPKRPKGCYKWKPIIEDDFIVREKIMRPEGDLVKELVLLQIDPVTGKEFYCGKLGTFTNKMRDELTKAKLPLVVQAAFEARYPKTGKIRNSKFMRVRSDKKLQECKAPRSWPEAEV